MTPPEEVQSTTRAAPPPVEPSARSEQPPTLASRVEPRDRAVLSDQVQEMRPAGKAGEQLADIVARYHDVVGALYERKAEVQWLGDFSGVVGNIASAPATIQGKENTGCKHTQLTTYQAIAHLTALDGDAWQAAPIRVGNGPFVHNAVAVWPSDAPLEDTAPGDVLVLDPWPQQDMEGSVRTLDEWRNLDSLVMMIRIGELRQVEL